MIPVVRGITTLLTASLLSHAHAQTQVPAARILAEAPAEVRVRPLIVARLVANAGEQPVPQGRKIDFSQRDQLEAVGSVAGLAALGAAGSAEAASAVVVMAPM